MSVRIIEGDCLATLRTLSDGAAQMCVTSPPYYGLRSYLPDVVRLKETLPDEVQAAVIADLCEACVFPLVHTTASAHNTACANPTGSSASATTGGSLKHSASANGSSETTSSKSAAPETSPRNSAQQTGQSYSGSASTEFPAGQSLPHEPSSDGALSAQTILCGTSEESLTRDGSAASLRSGNPSIQASSGSELAPLCGSATARGAGDAACIEPSGQTCRSTSTTSSPLPTQSCGQTQQTSPCSAKHAITSSTQKPTQPAIFFRKSEIPARLIGFFAPAEIGLEETPDAYVERLVDVFREVRRVLADDGVLWLNLGDSYAGLNNGYSGDHRPSNASGSMSTKHDGQRSCSQRRTVGGDLKNKDLMGIPWMVAFALRADGWWLRSAITWCKPAPMPESVRDRPTSATEQVFLLAKRPSYFYDASAIAEPFADDRMGSSGAKSLPYSDGSGRHDTLSQEGKPGLGASPSTGCRNARNWWVIAPSGYSGAHFATMPPALAERCIKAGSRPGDTILDPFGGAGTTGLVADRLGRSAILCELNPEYAALARERITGDCPMFAETAA